MWGVEKGPGTMASLGGASKRARLMSPCESDQLKGKTAEVARKIQEASDGNNYIITPNWAIMII